MEATNVVSAFTNEKDEQAFNKWLQNTGIGTLDSVMISLARFAFIAGSCHGLRIAEDLLAAAFKKFDQNTDQSEEV